MSDNILPDWLHEDLPEQKEEFQVDNMDKAEWAVTRAAESIALIQRAERQREHYISLINARYDEIIEPWQKEVGFREEQVAPYLKQQIYALKKGKSVKLLQGVAKMRSSEKVSVAQDGAVIDWLEENHPDMVKTKKTFDLAAIKKLLKAGEKVPGCELLLSDNFKIELEPVQAFLK